MHSVAVLKATLVYQHSDKTAAKWSQSAISLKLNGIKLQSVAICIYRNSHELLAFRVQPEPFNYKIT